jgi:hypothetical protein
MMEYNVGIPAETQQKNEIKNKTYNECFKPSELLLNP